MPDQRLKVRVFHQMHGCDTGCCAHVIELGDGRTRSELYSHPDSDQKDEEGIKIWARELAERIISRNWPECLKSIDWDSMVIETEEGCSNAN